MSIGKITRGTYWYPALHPFAPLHARAHSLSKNKSARVLNVDFRRFAKRGLTTKAKAGP